MAREVLGQFFGGAERFSASSNKISKSFSPVSFKSKSASFFFFTEAFRDPPPDFSAIEIQWVQMFDLRQIFIARGFDPPAAWFQK